LKRVKKSSFLQLLESLSLFLQADNKCIEHAALIKGTWTKDEPVMVRVHSSCFTGDIFIHCDVMWTSADKAMEMVETEGKGVIYLARRKRIDFLIR